MRRVAASDGVARGARSEAADRRAHTRQRPEVVQAAAVPRIGCTAWPSASKVLRRCRSKVKRRRCRPGPTRRMGWCCLLRVANNSDAATVKLDVSLGDAVGRLPLTTSILDGGDVASATLDLLRDEECVSTARVTVQALPGETLLSRKLATQEQTQVDPRQLW